MSYRAVAPAGSDDVESIGTGDSCGTSQDLRSDGGKNSGEYEEQHFCPSQSVNTRRMRDKLPGIVLQDSGPVRLPRIRIIRQRREREGTRQTQLNRRKTSGSRQLSAEY